MARWAKGLSGMVIFIFLGAFIVLFLAWSRVPDLLASSLSKKLGVLVEIGDIKLSWNSINIEKFEIGNPPEYTLSRALGIDNIFIQAPLPNYLKDRIEIDEIDLDNVHLGLEFESPTTTNGNWTTIMNNIKASSADTPGKTGKTVFIKQIVLTNISTDLIYRSAGKKPRRLPLIKRMVLKDVSSEGTGVMNQIMKSALGEMLKEVFIEQNLKDLMNQVFQKAAPSEVQELIAPFRGLLNTTPPLVPEQG